MRMILVLVAVVTTSAPVVADPLKEAAQLFDLGKKAEQREQYDAAIAFYERSFAIAPMPEMVANIAYCHRLKGDRAKSLERYQRYLELAPKGPLAGEARNAVTSLKAEIAAETARKEAERKEAERREAERKEAERKEAERRANEKRDADARVAAILAEERRRVRTVRAFRIGGLATAGVGVVSLGLSAYFGLRANGRADDIEGLTEAWDPRLESSGRAAQRNMIIFGITGTLAVGAGVTLFVLGRRTERSAPRVAITPGGVTVKAAF